jgi:pilus assembly protein Flp/PilA
MFNINKKEKGQGLVEYALILVLVAIVVIAALMVLGPIIGNVFSTVNNSLSNIGGNYYDTGYFVDWHTQETCGSFPGDVWGNGPNGVGCYHP